MPPVAMCHSERCRTARRSAPNRNKGYAYGAHVCAYPICHVFQPFTTQTACGFKVKVNNKQNLPYNLLDKNASNGCLTNKLLSGL